VALAPRDWSWILVRNHDEKIKDMGRSILPSTWSEGARWTRRQVNKRRRARVRVALAGSRPSGAQRGGKPAETPDFNDTYRAEIAQLVRDRRGMDKEHPLTRWALATVAADPVLRQAAREEQVAHFARLMPPTLIGRHAVSHIAAGLEWHDRDGCTNGYCCRRRGASQESAARAAAETERLVRQILAAGLHGTLNANLRAAAGRGNDGEPLPRRLLLGAHDAEAFARETAAFPEARAVVAAVAAISRLR
jgi:hypothetical protein